MFVAKIFIWKQKPKENDFESIHFYMYIQYNLLLSLQFKRPINTPHIARTNHILKLNISNHYIYKHSELSLAQRKINVSCLQCL